MIIPSAVLADDLLFVTVTSRDSTSGSANVTCTDDSGDGVSWSVLHNTSDKKAWVFWKRANAGTNDGTITVASCVGSASGVLKCFSGADTGATPYTNVTEESNASGDETHAGITPSTADSMLCASIHNYANDNAVTTLSSVNFGAFTTTEKLSTGGLDCACAFGHDLVTSGATGNITWSQTDGTTYAIVWAIKPLSVVEIPMFLRRGSPGQDMRLRR